MKTTAISLLVLVFAACGGGGGAGGTGGATGATGGGGGSGGGFGGGSGIGAAAVSLQFTSNQNLQASVDTAGTYTNVYPENIAVIGGAPTQAGYSWSFVLGPGLPNTITVDPATGVFGGTLPSNFVMGPPGTNAGTGEYVYDLTITVSDGISRVTSAPGQMRVFIKACNSSPPYGSAKNCAGQPSAGGSITAPFPQGPPVQLAYSANTQQYPFDITWDQGLHVGKPFGFSLPFQGGIGPYRFVLVSGTLPPGLSLLGPSGTLVGTISATAFGNGYPFTVTATDAAANQTTAYYIIGSSTSPLLN